MKLKFTTLLAVLLLAVLAMPHTADAQNGYSVSRTRGLDKVVATGNNQAVPAVVLTSRSSTADPAITRPEATDITISVMFGDLPIVQATAWRVPTTGDPVQVTATANPFDTESNSIQFKMGDKELQIFVPSDATGDGIAVSTAIKLADLRLDLTSLAAGDSVPITVTASDQQDTVDLGTGAGRGSVSASLTTASDGLTVAGTKGNGLTCKSITGTSVTVAEGFAGAWMPTLMGPDAGGGDDHATPQDTVKGAVQIRLDVLNFPNNAGAKITWPESVPDTRSDTDPTTAGDQSGSIATLTRVPDDSDANGKFVVYTYANMDSMPTTDPNNTPDDPSDDVANPTVQPYLSDAARSFKIDDIKFENFGGAAINVTARLGPMAKRNSSDGKKNAADLKSTLSFEHAAEDPEFADDARAGAWVIVEDCVTYLLYPFVTCGATPGWTTGISVSNTSKDAGVFGPFDVSTDQSGAVVLYGFPRGAGAEPVMGMLTSDLAAGDTHTLSCDQSIMAGMEGYAIIKANFQHARGMGFVLGNFADGAAVDVSHGYKAETIIDPAARSESLLP